jgi:hypothetical protein
MKKNFIKILILFLASSFIVSCDKDDDDNNNNNNSNTSVTGSFDVNMEYVWAMSTAPFSLNQMLYHPMTGDSLNFSMFRHYISNIRLKRADNTYWAATNSYHLLDASIPSSLTLNFSNVPAGEYVAMEVTFGVDSARNVSGVQSGALDPANGMFWDWNSGYIMLKAEGTSPQAAGGSFEYHLGGFSGTNNTVDVRELSFPSGEKLVISTGTTSVVHMKANPARLFHSYGSVSNGAMIHMPGPAAVTMSDGFNTWVMIDQIDN